jgi:DNA-binding transcriptional LysR family regulator
MKITNLDDLHIFRTVALKGGVLRATALLNRVSSNVTTRIKQFEDRLGSKLFCRQDRNVVLTDAGRTLLGHAERLLRMADEAKQELCHGVIRVTLRLGCERSLPASKRAQGMAAFKACQRRVWVDSTRSQQSIAAVRGRFTAPRPVSHAQRPHAKYRLMSPLAEERSFVKT